MFKRYQQLHFVGIGGVGMSGIAEVLLNLGYRISGSDLRPSAATRRLKQRGARLHYGHLAAHVGAAHVVVVSSAVAVSNPEVVEARRRGIPVVQRAEMLAELMRLKYGIAVAGTHGKTTTTSLIAAVLATGRLDPTIIIGGRVNAWRTNARLGKGEFLVAEADESDRSFLRLDPTIAVITNIDREHMENYRDFDDVRQAYRSFAERAPFYGTAVCCADHPETMALAQRLSRPVVTYGVNVAADYMARNIRARAERLHFEVLYRNKVLGNAQLRMPGRHNVGNALAAIAVGHFLEIPFRTIVRGLARFRGIERRFQILRRQAPIVVSDYAHHPVELAATIRAAREGWPEKRVIVVHQPHRYSRLQALFRDFVEVLAGVDGLVLMRLYEASERPIPGVSTRRLWGALRRRRPELAVRYAESPQKVLELTRRLVTRDAIVLFLGAGDISKVAAEFVKA
ncbi:MAG: UDP-N-acetylmuramate--L-alanine ligase [Deltaproteobacteria bacterium]|nr:UDP-N-acetylmuramate--L-alanine ligase [Deltaproteobacteria bacterium]